MIHFWHIDVHTGYPSKYSNILKFCAKKNNKISNIVTSLHLIECFKSFDSEKKNQINSMKLQNETENLSKVENNEELSGCKMW